MGLELLHRNVKKNDSRLNHNNESEARVEYGESSKPLMRLGSFVWFAVESGFRELYLS